MNEFEETERETSYTSASANYWHLPFTNNTVSSVQTFYRQMSEAYRRLSPETPLSTRELSLLRTKLEDNEAELDPVMLARVLFLLLGATPHSVARQHKLLNTSADALVRRSRYSNASRTLHHFIRNAVITGLSANLLHYATSHGAEWISKMIKAGLTGLHLGHYATSFSADWISEMINAGLTGLHLWQMLKQSPSLLWRTAVVLQQAAPLISTLGLMPAAVEEMLGQWLSDNLPETVFSACDLFCTLRTAAASWQPTPYLLLAFYTAVYLYRIRDRHRPLPEGWGRLLAALPSWGRFIVRWGQWLERSAGSLRPNRNVAIYVGFIRRSGYDIQARSVLSSHGEARYQEWQGAKNHSRMITERRIDHGRSTLRLQTRLLTSQADGLPLKTESEYFASNASPYAPYRLHDEVPLQPKPGSESGHGFARPGPWVESIHKMLTKTQDRYQGILVESIDGKDALDQPVARYTLLRSQPEQTEVGYALLSEMDAEKLWDQLGPSEERLKTSGPDDGVKVNKSQTADINAAVSPAAGRYIALSPAAGPLAAALGTASLTGMKMVSCGLMLGGLSWLLISLGTNRKEPGTANSHTADRTLPSFSLPEREALSDVEKCIENRLLHPLNGMGGKTLSDLIEEMISDSKATTHRIKRTLPHQAPTQTSSVSEIDSVQLDAVLHQPLSESLRLAVGGETISEVLHQDLAQAHLAASDAQQTRIVSDMLQINRVKRQINATASMAIYQIHDAAEINSAGLQISEVGFWEPAARLTNAWFDFPSGHYIILNYDWVKDTHLLHKQIQIRIPEEKRIQGLWQQEAAEQIRAWGENEITAGEVTVYDNQNFPSINFPINSTDRNVIYVRDGARNVKWQILREPDDGSLTGQHAERNALLASLFPTMDCYTSNDIDCDKIYWLTQMDHRPVISEGQAASVNGYSLTAIISNAETHLPKNSFFCLKIIGTDNRVLHRLSISVPDQKRESSLWQPYVIEKIHHISNYLAFNNTQPIKIAQSLPASAETSHTTSAHENDFAIYAATNAAIGSVIWWLDKTPVVPEPTSNADTLLPGVAAVKAKMSELDSLSCRLTRSRDDYATNAEGEIYNKNGKVARSFFPWMRHDLETRSETYIRDLKQQYERLKVELSTTGPAAQTPFRMALQFVAWLDGIVSKDEINRLGDAKSFLEYFFISRYRAKPGIMDEMVRYICWEYAYYQGDIMLHPRGKGWIYQGEISLFDFIVSEEKRQQFVKEYIREVRFAETGQTINTTVQRTIQDIILPENLSPESREAIPSVYSSGEIREGYDALVKSMFGRASFETRIKLEYDHALFARLMQLSSESFVIDDIEAEDSVSQASPRQRTLAEAAHYIQSAQVALSSGRGIITLKHAEDYANGLVLLKGSHVDEYLAIPLSGKKFYSLSISSTGKVSDNAILFLKTFFPAGTLQRRSLVMMIAGRSPGPLYKETIRLYHSTAGEAVLDHLWEGYKGYTAGIPRSLFPTRWEYQEHEAARVLRDVVTPVLTTTSFILLIPTSALASLPEELITLELMEGVSVDILATGLRLTLSGTNYYLLAELPTEYLLEAAANADRAVAAQKAWGDFVKALSVSMLFMSPQFMPGAPAGLRRLAAEQEYSRLSVVTKKAGLTRSIIQSFRTAENMLGQTIDEMAVIPQPSLAELDNLSEGSQILLTARDSSTVTQVIVKDGMGKIWQLFAGEMQEVTSMLENGDSGLMFRGQPVLAYVDGLSGEDVSLADAFYSTDNWDITCRRRVRRGDDVSGCIPVLRSLFGGNQQSLKTKVREYTKNVDDMVLADESRAAQERASAFESGRRASDEAQYSWMDEGGIKFKLDIFASKQHPQSNVVLDNRALGALSGKIDTELERLPLSTDKNVLWKQEKVVSLVKSYTETGKGISISGSCWDFVIDAQNGAGMLTEEQYTRLRQTRTNNFHDFLGKNPMMIRNVEMVEDIPPGARLAFVDNGELKHAMISMGGARAVGVNNIWLTAQGRRASSGAATVINLQTELNWQIDGLHSRAGASNPHGSLVTFYVQSQQDLRRASLAAF